MKTQSITIYIPENCQVVGVRTYDNAIICTYECCKTKQQKKRIPIGFLANSGIKTKDNDAV